MLFYLLRRIGQAVLVLWAAFTIAFLLLQALPGDAILIKFQNPDMGLSPAQIAEIRASYGVDSPLPIQYLHTIGNFLTGDFGYSIEAGVPVRDQIAQSLPTTLRLAVLGFLAATFIAFGIGIAAHLTQFRWLRNLLHALPPLFISVPTFWLGIILIQVVSFRLRLIPVINPGEWRGLILPILTVAIPISAPLAQILLRAMDEIETQPFVAVVRAKGATRARVLFRHVIRNAMIPTLTIAGILLGELLAGAVITETVFGLSGIGELTQQAVNGEDTSVLEAVVVLSAVAFVLINLLVDLAYPLLDPRLKQRKGAVT
ncbi:MAG TPA: ABC transporter permease [Devosiaceae bacterium]|nr:ABC transporter permease [Devosiaceae bacterium]